MKGASDLLACVNTLLALRTTGDELYSCLLKSTSCVDLELHLYNPLTLLMQTEMQRRRNADLERIRCARVAILHGASAAGPMGATGVTSLGEATGDDARVLSVCNAASLRDARISQYIAILFALTSKFTLLLYSPHSSMRSHDLRPRLNPSRFAFHCVEISMDRLSQVLFD